MHLGREGVKIRGLTVGFSGLADGVGRDKSGDALELALVLRFPVRLDGGMHTVHGHAAVKTDRG